MTIATFGLRAAIIVALAGSLGACASSQLGGGNTVSRDSTRSIQNIEYGTVIDARQVKVEGTRSGAGMIVGGAAGAAVGSQIGGGRAERTVAGVAGALIGAAVGDAVEEGVTSQNGIEYTVRLERGGTVAIVQGAEQIIPRGARVQVVYGNDGSARVVQVR